MKRLNVLAQVVGRNLPISPKACHREEVVAALTEAVWPECVEAMRPLVQDVVRVSRENEVVYGRAEPVDKTLEGEHEDTQGFKVLDITKGRSTLSTRTGEQVLDLPKRFSHTLVLYVPTIPLWVQYYAKCITTIKLYSSKFLTSLPCPS